MMRGCANNIIKGNYSTDPNCIEKCFHFLEELGSGGFGKVKLAIHLLTNEKVAIKIIDKKAVGHDLPRITAELEALKQLAHQHICRMYQYVETEDKFYVVMEYCNGGEMFDYIVRKERLTEPEARHFFRQLVQAIAYIHSLGFAHRDLKPENLLLTNEQQLKVIDFGLCARPLKGLDAVLETCCGSPAYAAPELLQNNYYFGNEADIWSMGVLLYTLLCGCLPFDDGSYPRLYQKIRKGVYLEPNYLTSDTKEFLRCMLTVDPKQRATIRQILAHPWLNKSYRQQIKWQSIYSRDIVDEDVCRELAYFYGCRLEEVIAQVRQWKYDYKTANYLILLQKKERKQNIALLSHKKIVKQPSALTIHGSLDNDLDLSGIDDFSSDGSFQNDEFLMAPTEKKMEAMALCCPSQIFAFSPQKKFLRQQLNGDQSLSISPVNLENSVKKHPICSNDKENQRPLPMPTTPKARNFYPNGAPLPIEKCGGDDISRPISIYTTPRRVIPNAVVCSSSAHRRPNSADRPSRNVATSHNQQKQRLADQQQQQRSNSSDRPCSFTPSPAPSYSRKARFDMRNELKTPGRLRQRMFSSLERKKEKIVNFLTPRRDRSSDAPAKLKCTKTMVNVSVTSSTDPAKVRDELVNVLRKHDIMPQQNGWKIFGSRKNAAGSGQTTVELEVVAIENMGYVGVKRKRIQGDAFTYKRICEEVKGDKWIQIPIQTGPSDGRTLNVEAIREKCENV